MNYRECGMIWVLSQNEYPQEFALIKYEKLTSKRIHLNISNKKVKQIYEK
jgi:hypothetical protein